MKTIQPGPSTPFNFIQGRSLGTGQEVLSLFGLTLPAKTLNTKLSPYRWLISVFLIALILGLSAGFMVRFFDLTPKTMALVKSEENVAFQPSQQIIQEISRGYLGNYR